MRTDENNRMMESPLPRGVERGSVDSWNDERGFGFIEVAGERNLFVHRTAIVDDRRGQKRKQLAPGDRVEFERAPGKQGKGPQAINVKVL